uniref:Uncharacterized protein n=1 Tax=Thermosporothrix sp. COM3 TaxID=2490863 RepID=A0A455SJ11_9CHLR|nr:hypothetical protein KTC_23010 [Thermosporothrix sp. COM3]
MVMSVNELEHLELLLEKQPIIATWTAQDILERPEIVRENYLKHVRSFVVIGKGATSTDSDQVTIADYEKRLLKLVKNNGAAKGYITADYGYGKTSSAAFIWHRCEQAEIVAVPPFQIQKLEHLFSATYGWVRYKLSQSHPQLLSEAEQMYHSYVDRDINTFAKDEKERELLQRIYNQGKYVLTLRGLDYVKFFEEMTQLVRRAGYNGLVVIADEVQQYIDPDIKAGVRDPLTDLFDIVQALMTRKGTLPFALLFSIPLKELGLMNDQRSDLVQRLKSDGLALDLSVMYNHTFARDLWFQLARELEFEALQDKIVLPETLNALGQISARPDLATGPRTVVDVFKLMARRYKEQNGAVAPFTPLDLVDAFLRNEIHYDNVAKLQNVVNGHLSHQFVKEDPTCQKAIKLMAAFPVDGLPERYFDVYGIRKAIELLVNEAQGDIITWVGGGYDDEGRLRETRAMLVGMEAQKVNTNWLDTTLREYIRSYYERSARQATLAVHGFQALLKEHVFRGENWKLVRSLEYGMLHNRTMFWEGAFPNTTRKKYPGRLLQVRILGAKEQLRDTALEGDLLITFQLQLHEELSEAQRRMYPGTIENREKETMFSLNMSYNSGKENYGDLLSTLGQMVAPWKMTPTLLLSLYAYLEEKRVAGSIPKIDDEMIRANFQPVLLDHAFNQLFNAELGAELGTAGIRIIEETVKRQLELHYSQYKTLMTNMQWKQSLKRYHVALSNLPTPYERQGKQLFNATKQELAAAFKITVPPLENFLHTNSLLLRAEGANKWRFTLHPLEEQILALLKQSSLTEAPRLGGKPRQKIERETAEKMARAQGYRVDEFEEVLVLMQQRGLISFSATRSQIIAETVRVPQVEDIQRSLQDYRSRLELVASVVPDDARISSMLEDTGKYDLLLRNLSTKPDEQKQTSLERTIRTRQNDLNNIIHHYQQLWQEQTRDLLRQREAVVISSERLNQPLPEGFFQPQLQTQRVSLLKEYGELVEKRERLRKQLESIAALLVKDDYSVTDLIRAGEERKSAQQILARLSQQESAFISMEAYYGAARQLLREALDLRQQFEYISAEMSAAFQQELDAWSLHISGELSSRKLKALEGQKKWKEQFDEIARRFHQQMQAERNRFETVHTTYKTFLLRQTRYAQGWQDVRFNPADSQDSYSQLWKQVQAAIQAELEGMQQEMQETYDRCARQLGGALQNLPAHERPGAQQEVEALQLHLQQMIERLRGGIKRITDMRFLQKLRAEGIKEAPESIIGPEIAQLNSLHQWLNESVETLAGYEQRIAAIKLTPQEEEILAVLQRLQQGTEGEIELGLLLQHLPEHLSITWQDISRLYSKQRLSIKIAPVSFD